MKSNQKLSLLFWLFKAKATKDGKAPLYVRVTIEGKDIEISLRRKVNPAFWDADGKKDKEQGSESKKTNSCIEQTKVDLERHYTVLQSQYKIVTPQMLKNVFHGFPAELSTVERTAKSFEQKKLLQVADIFIEEFEKMVEKEIRSFETLKQWKSSRTKLAEYIALTYKTDDININMIEYSFANAFFTYLTLEREQILGEPAAMKQLRNLKQLLTYSETKKWLERNPIEKFKTGCKEKDVDPLEFSDVMQIYEKPMVVRRLEEVRDAFIFQCFTGFAYQDIYNLSPDNIIKVGNKEELWLIKDRGKTGVSEMVPILPIIASIIAKYQHDPYCIKHNRLVPVNSNQKYNGYLKEVAAICGIKRNLTTHLARHTFADIMLNICNIPLEDVSKMLGHSSIKTTMRYCRVRKIRISNNMRVAKSVLFTKSGKFKTIAA